MTRSIMQQRYIFAVLASTGAVLNLSGRNCLNLAIVNIAKNSNCKNSTNNSSGSDSVDQSCVGVVWSDGDVANLLGAFFWGIFISEVVSGPIVDILGGKIILTVANLSAALMTLSIPYLTSTSVNLTVISQIISGVANGVAVPSFHTLIGRWEPESERGRISTIIYTGSPLSSVFSLLLTGVFSSFFSWTYAFYVFGGLPFLWSFFWFWNVYDSPDLHPHISQEEKTMLDKQTQTGSQRPKLRDIPLKRILWSPAVWAMIIANVAYCWSFSFIASLVPTFLDTVFHVSTNTNAVLSALPFIGNYIFSYIVTFLLGSMDTAGWITTNTRIKVATTISLCGMAICIGLVPVLDSNVYITAALFTACWTFAGAHVSGAWSNAIVLAPNFAASLMGLSGLFSYLCSSFLPTTFAALTRERSTVSGWSPGLYLTTFILAIANVIFIIFGTSEVQEWNNMSESHKPDDPKQTKDRDHRLSSSINGEM